MMRNVDGLGAIVLSRHSFHIFGPETTDPIFTNNYYGLTRCLAGERLSKTVLRYDQHRKICSVARHQ